MSQSTERPGLRGILAPVSLLDRWLQVVLVLLVATCALRYVDRHPVDGLGIAVLAGALVLALAYATRTLLPGRSWWPTAWVAGIVVIWAGLTIAAPSFAWCAVPVAFAVLRVVPFGWADRGPGRPGRRAAPLRGADRADPAVPRDPRLRRPGALVHQPAPAGGRAGVDRAARRRTRARPDRCRHRPGGSRRRPQRGARPRPCGARGGRLGSDARGCAAAYLPAGGARPRGRGARPRRTAGPAAGGLLRDGAHRPGTARDLGARGGVGGYVEVESAPGEGTTVSVRFPVEAVG